MPFLHDHATAIGYLCIYYSALEHQVNRVIGDLTLIDEEEIRVITNEIDLLKKMPALKALAFLKKPSAQWYADIDLFTWAVTSWIIPKRNRFVHDQWLSLPSGIMRLYERTRIARPQSRKPKTLTTYERVEQNAEEIWELASETRDMANLFRLLGAAFRHGRAAVEPEKVFPPQYRDQWRARRKPPKADKQEGPCDPDLEDQD